MWAKEMAQPSQALTTLPEDPGSVPSNLQKLVCSSTSKGFNTLSHIYIQVHTYTHRWFFLRQGPHYVTASGHPSARINEWVIMKAHASVTHLYHSLLPRLREHRQGGKRKSHKQGRALWNVFPEVAWFLHSWTHNNCDVERMWTWQPKFQHGLGRGSQGPSVSRGPTGKL